MFYWEIVCEGLEEYGLDLGTAEKPQVPLLSCHSRGDQVLSIPSHPWELLQSYSIAEQLPRGARCQSCEHSAVCSSGRGQVGVLHLNISEKNIVLFRLLTHMIN